MEKQIMKKTNKFKVGNIEMTDTLKTLLSPKLHSKEPIFTSPLKEPGSGEKVYELTDDDINLIRSIRGGVVDLHPGMGGVAPERILNMIDQGVKITSLDFMLTKGCNFECTWCFAESSPTEKDYIPFDLLQTLTEDALELGVELFVLTGGEPLMYRDPKLGRQGGKGKHLLQVVKMIYELSKLKGKKAKILIFDDVALITPFIAEQFAKYEVGLCTKGDTLNEELQDYKVNQLGAYKKMQKGYKNLINAGYGSNPKLRVVVNSVLDHTTFDGMLDLHFWVMENGFDHSIVPVHYCGAAESENQETGIHSPHVKVLYDIISIVDEKYFGKKWRPWSAFTYNKTCNRNRSGLHIRADGDVTACSESPDKASTDRYTFGNIFSEDFDLKKLVDNSKLKNYRKEFSKGYGTYVCSPDVCDLYLNNLCQGGCATRSAYSKIDYETGLITKNSDVHNYSIKREDPLCPAWTNLAIQQGILQDGLLESIHRRIVEKSNKLDSKEFEYHIEGYHLELL